MTKANMGRLLALCVAVVMLFSLCPVVTLSADGSNTAPVFVLGDSGSVQVTKNGSATDIKDLLHVNDSDSGQTLTWSQVTAPGHGTLTIVSATASSGADVTPGGTVTYTPDTGYSGSDSFAIQVSDGTDTDTVTITVTVTPGWEQLSLPSEAASETMGYVAYGNNCFMAVTYDNGRVLKLADNEEHWTLLETLNDMLMYIAFGNNSFVTPSSISEKTYYSTDKGSTWNQKELGTHPGGSLAGVTYGSAGFLILSNAAEGDNSLVYTTKDFVEWTEAIIPYDAPSVGRSLYNAAFGNGKYVITCNTSGVIFSSEDAVNWKRITLPETMTGEIYGIAYGGGRFVMVSTGGDILYSSDGESWSTAAKVASVFYGVTYADNCFYAVGGGGVIMTSPDGINNWAAEASGTTSDLFSIAYGNNKLVAVGNNGVTLVKELVAENTAPTATNKTATATVGVEYTYDLSSMFSDTDTLTYSVTGDNGGGTAMLNTDGKTVEYTPVASDKDITGGVVINVKATDTASQTAEATITLSINQPPTLSTNLGVTVNEGGSTTIQKAALETADSDTAAASISYTLTAVPAHGKLYKSSVELAVSGTFTQDDINNGRITYTHDSSETTSDSFKFTVSDGAGGNIAETTFTITVNAVNDEPSIETNAKLTLDEDAAATVLGNSYLKATDPEGAALTYTVTALPQKGELRNSGTKLAVNGTFTQADIDLEKVTYTPAANKNGEDTFGFTLSDGNKSVTGTFSIGITQVNDAPTDISLSNASILAGATGVNATVGTFSTIDADEEDTFVYGLVSGIGDTDNASFNISGNVLRTSGTLSVKNYSIRIKVADSMTASIEKVFTVNVANLGAKTLTADTSNNNVDNDLEITFAADAAFESAISTVTCNGTPLAEDTDYIVGSGKLTLKPSGGNSTLTTAEADKTIVVTALGYSDSTVKQTVLHGVLARLAVAQDIIAPAMNGGKFAQQPKITLQDQYGNTCTGNSTTQVTAAKNDSGSWTLTGNKTTTASSGVASFSDLGATNTASVSDAQLKFSVTGLIDVTSAKVTLPPPSPAQTVSVSADASSPAAGTSNAVRFTVKNSLGNTDETFEGVHDITLSGVETAPDGSYGSFNGETITAGTQKISVAFSKGAASPILRLNKADGQTIGFSVSGVLTPGTNTLTITPAAGTAADMTVTKDIAAPAANGGKFAQQPQITLKDQYGNICLNNSTTQVTASKNDSGSWTLTGAVKVTANKGVASFSDLGATSTAAVKDAQLKFSAAGLADVISAKVMLPAPNASSSSSGSSSSTSSSPVTDSYYVQEQHITGSSYRINVDLNKGSTVLSAGQISSLAAQNQTKPVVLTGSGYTITFPVGTLKRAGANRDYDMKISFNTGAHAEAIRSLTGGSFITMLDFNQHGALPATAQVSFYAGALYAGKTLYYYSYKPSSGLFALIQTVKADKNGYVTISQSFREECVLTSSPLSRVRPDIPETGGGNAESVTVYIDVIFDFNYENSEAQEETDCKID